MYIHDLRINSRLEIEIVRDNCNEVLRIDSKVDGIKRNEIRVIVQDCIAPYIILRDIKTIYVSSKEDGKFQRWVCEGIDIKSFEGYSILVICCDKEAEEINRRSAFRLPYYEKMEYIFEGKTYQGIYKDLSAIGLGFLANEEHNVDDVLYFTLKDDNKRIDVVGVIVRKEELDNIVGYQYRYGVKIQNTDISCFVFKKQLEQIRKNRCKY